MPGYADCSSLLRDVYLAASGVNIGETTSGQIARLAAYRKPLSALQEGDILMRIESGSNHAPFISATISISTLLLPEDGSSSPPIIQVPTGHAVMTPLLFVAASDRARA